MDEIDVLVVDTLSRQRAKLAFFLRAAGYRVDVADSYEAARATFAGSRPACLVTGVRLGVYNGLHLIARAHYLHASIASVLTHDVADPVLEREARAYGTAFLVLPCPGDVLVGAVRESIVTASKSSELCISQRKVSAGEDSAVAAGATFLLTADTAIV